MSPITEAKKKANAKYENKAYDKILIRVETGQKDKIKAHAEQYQPEAGEIGKPGYTPKGSINGFIARAISETIERDKSMQPADVPEIAIAKSRPEVLAHAEIMGESLPDFVNRAIDVTMERDNISVQLAKKSGAGKDSTADK